MKTVLSYYSVVNHDFTCSSLFSACWSSPYIEKSQVEGSKGDCQILVGGRITSPVGSSTPEPAEPATSSRQGRKEEAKVTRLLLPWQRSSHLLGYRWLPGGIFPSAHQCPLVGGAFSSFVITTKSRLRKPVLILGSDWERSVLPSQSPRRAKLWEYSEDKQRKIYMFTCSPYMQTWPKEPDTKSSKEEKVKVLKLHNNWHFKDLNLPYFKSTSVYIPLGVVQRSILLIRMNHVFSSAKSSY